MKLKSIYLKNFRAFAGETTIQVDNLTAFIGRNDAGKSTILEALDIFFDGGTVKMDSDDANIKGAKNDVRIRCTFCDLPRELIIDADSSTTLFEEFLLNDDGDLQIVKHFDCKVKTTPKPKTFIIANHPSIDIVNICFNKKLLNLEKE